MYIIQYGFLTRKHQIKLIFKDQSIKCVINTFRNKVYIN